MSVHTCVQTCKRHDGQTPLGALEASTDSQKKSTDIFNQTYQGHLRLDMCTDMCLGMRLDMRLDMCLDMRLDMRLDMHLDVQLDMLAMTDTTRSSSKGATARCIRHAVGDP